MLGDAVVHRVTLGPAPVRLGRAPSNEVVLREPDVSGNHAVVWRDGGGVVLEDLGSTNGTWVDGARIGGRVALDPGVSVRLGSSVGLRIVADLVPEPVIGPLRVERDGGPVSLGVTSAHFALPGHDDAVIVVTGAEVWLAEDGIEREALEVDRPFEVDGVTYWLRHDLDPTPATLRRELTEPALRLEVDMEAGTAVLVDLPSHGRCVFDAEHRVALLYVLARAWLAEEGAGRGWLDDDLVARQVWGRAHREHLPNNVNVLIHRVRSQTSRAGLDRWFIEKRTGRTRLRLQEVRLAGGG